MLLVGDGIRRREKKNREKCKHMKCKQFKKKKIALFFTVDEPRVCSERETSMPKIKSEKQVRQARVTSGVISAAAAGGAAKPAPVSSAEGG